MIVKSDQQHFFTNEDDNNALILDGSFYVYSSYFSFKYLQSITGEPTGAIYGLIKTIFSFIKRFNTHRIIMVFDSGGVTFRKDMYHLYKSNRTKTEPQLYQQFNNIASIIHLFGLSCYQVSSYEGDDVIGTLSNICANFGYRTLICSQDKDFIQLIKPNVSLYRNDAIITANNYHEFLEISPNKFDQYLALVGDKSDCIPGVKGIGPKMATKLLREYHSIDNILDNLNDLEESTRLKIEGSLDNLNISRKLTTIKTDLPLVIDCAKLGFNKSRFKREDLIGKLKSLGLYSFISLVDTINYI